MRLVTFTVLIDHEDAKIEEFVEKDGKEVMNRLNNMIKAKGVNLRTAGNGYDMFPVILGVKNGTPSRTS